MQSRKLQHKTKDSGKHSKMMSRKRANNLNRARLARWDRSSVQTLDRMEATPAPASLQTHTPLHTTASTPLTPAETHTPTPAHTPLHTATLPTTPSTSQEHSRNGAHNQTEVTTNENRIFNLSNLSSAVQTITKHAAECGGECNVTGESYRAGLASVLQIRCEECCEVFSVPSSKRIKTVDGKHWEVNLGAVLGQMMTGGGASRLATTMAAVGVPSMSKQTFTSTERAWSAEMERQLVTSMREAGAEEKRIAIEQNISHHGIPAITVIVDGGWSKRSHKHSYNAKSGVAVIIGKETRKLLFLGVRNKYCSTCSIARNANQTAPPHTCYKNWEQSSCAMESDIVVEGFRMSETTHGVRYMEVIGDGDSSVLSAIRSQVLWGPYVKKLECANHACKNYRAKLESIVQEHPRYKGRGGLTQKVIRRLTAAARAAIRMHSKTRKIDQLRHDLRNAPYHIFGDHSNCSASFCKANCNNEDDTSAADSPDEMIAVQPDGEEREITPESAEEEMPDQEMTVVQPRGEGEEITPESEEEATFSDQMLSVIDEALSIDNSQLQDENEARSGAPRVIDSLPSGLLNLVLAAGDRLVSLAPQLIDNVTSNLAETYMGIRTYFDGGKLYNRVQSGSFEARCYAAGLRFQNGVQWCLPTWERYVGSPATDSLQSLVQLTHQSRQKDKERKLTAKYITQRKRSKHQGYERTSTDYGPNATQPDLSRSELDQFCKEYKHRLNLTESERSTVEQQTREQADDQSGMWYEYRRSRLTASNFGVIAKRRSTTLSAPLVKQLLYSNRRSTPAMRWGQEHEKDARQSYKSSNTTLTVTKSGLVIDTDHGWLGCSPDDLVMDTSSSDQLGIVEYKCPYSAKDLTMEEASKLKNFPAKLINGKLILKRNHNYYYQVQGCMAICKRRWCDFVIWTPNWTSTERIAFDSGFWEKTVPILLRFYDYALLPELASPRHPHGQPLRELLHDCVS